MDNDLSHIFANDPEEGQVHHGNLPHEAKLHFARMFGHAAGLSKDPGLYKGPDIKQPEGFETPDDLEGAQEEHQDQAIQNISEGSPANILSPPKPKPLPSMAPPPTTPSQFDS